MQVEVEVVDEVPLAAVVGAGEASAGTDRWVVQHLLKDTAGRGMLTLSFHFKLSEEVVVVEMGGEEAVETGGEEAVEVEVAVVAEEDAVVAEGPPEAEAA